MAKRIRWNQTKCPADKTPLLWRGFAGCTLYVTVGRWKVYNARCPKCGTYYEQRRIDHEGIAA
jgi:hypothetical protein